METDEPGADKLQEYEAVVELASKSRAPLSKQSMDKIDELIQDLNIQDDPVYLNNCLQLVADLARSNDALSFLESRQVPQKLLSLLDQRDPLIIPHALKFFYRIDPKDLGNKYPDVLNKVFDFCQSENDQLLDYAIDFVASIGRKGYVARRVLNDHPLFQDKCLKKLGSTIIRSTTLLKCRALDCIRDLLELYENDPKEESSKLSDQIYHSIIEGENKMSHQLLVLCQVPFKEISAGSVSVVEAIAAQEWGLKELAGQPELLKFIKSKSSGKDHSMNGPAFATT